jgi:Tol biopolymer transport system component
MLADSDRLHRFQQEARAAGMLNHPNILVVYDVGTSATNPYLVSELLEGETLRQALARGPLPLRKIIDCGVQVAKGLSAAHAKGIVHRDLKPENLFIAEGGHVKILDFGLAKLSETEPQATEQTLTAQTDPGTVLGTVGYMSPEQVRGLPTDGRSDLFSLGAILYEMISGRRVFQGATAADTMSSILKDEPPDLSIAGITISPALDRLIRRCLEKNPQDRFQSAQDLAFALDTLGGSSTSTMVSRAEATRPLFPWKRTLGIGIVTVLLAAIGYFVARYAAAGPRAVPSYHALTFRRGLVHAARFGPDGQTIVYSAAWNGEKSRLFVTRSDSPESRALEQTDANLFAVSSSGDVAISVGCTGFLMPLEDCGGTLARMSLSGGAPREISSHIRAADWSPDGKQLAVAREVSGGTQLEYPIGRVLAQSAGWISSVRISPKGNLIAFLDHPAFGDDGGTVVIMDARGQRRISSGPWGSLEGLAWAPSGSEVWFVGSNPDQGWANSLRSLTITGKQRLLLRLPGVAKLHDVSSDGRVLLSTETFGLELFVHQPGSARDRDLSWLGSSCVSDISPDGHLVTFWDGSDSATSDIGFDTYLRNVDRADPVKLGPGDLGVFSPDSKWVLAVLPSAHKLELLPTGVGDIKTVDGYGVQNHLALAWLPGGRTVSFAGNEAGQGWRIYLQDLSQGQPRAITPKITQPNTYDGPSTSRDGRLVWARDLNRMGWLYPVKGGKPLALKSLAPDDQWISWTADSRGAFVFTGDGIPARVFRIAFNTGSRTQIFTIMPADPAGVAALSAVRITPDGKTYAYSYVRLLSKLFLVTGIKSK